MKSAPNLELIILFTALFANRSSALCQGAGEGDAEIKIIFTKTQTMFLAYISEVCLKLKINFMNSRLTEFL